MRSWNGSLSKLTDAQLYRRRKNPDKSVINQQVNVFCFCENVRTGYFVHSVLAGGVCVCTTTVRCCGTFSLTETSFRKYVEFMKMGTLHVVLPNSFSYASFARVPKDMGTSWNLGFRYDAWCKCRSLALRVVNSEWWIWHSRVRLSPLYTQDTAELNLYGRYFM